MLYRILVQSSRIRQRIFMYYNHPPLPAQRQTILGIDLGTSGVRGVIVERQHSLSRAQSELPDVHQDKILIQKSITFRSENLKTDYCLRGQTCKAKSDLASVQDPNEWLVAVVKLLKQLAVEFDLQRVNAIICDATSSTVMLCDQQGRLLTNGLMYNDAQAHVAAEKIKQLQQYDTAAIKTAATGASSSLAKVLYLSDLLQTNQPIQVVHQIDWLNSFFTDFLVSGHCYSDENNLLKFGYDPISGTYPEWVKTLIRRNFNLLLPQAGKPGEVIMKVSGSTQKRFGFSANCQVLYGTTDSIAGFLASGAKQLNDTVTSLGSTLAIKQLVAKPVFASEFGLYSHKVKDLWLLGGASNGGGKVLLNYYTLAQIIWLDNFLQILWRLDEENVSIDALEEYPALKNCRYVGDYYSLPAKGERFPVNNANLQPKFANKPKQSLGSIDLQALSHQDTYSKLQSSYGAEFKVILQHAEFFASIVQGLVQIEKQAYQLIADKQTYHQTACLYSVGGGTKNGYWQLLRQAHLRNCLQSPFSVDAAYGVTRLANI